MEITILYRYYVKSTIQLQLLPYELISRIIFGPAVYVVEILILYLVICTYTVEITETYILTKIC